MLGRFAVWQGNREITRFRTQKTASLLAYLALNASRPLPRVVLTEIFWPDNTQEAARANLSVAVSALRHQLEPPGVPRGAVLIADNTQVSLNLLSYTSDVDDFESLLQEAHSTTEPQQRVGLFKRALDLYGGDLLPGHYEEWVLTERDRLQEVYRQALGQVIKAYAENRQLEQALEYAHRLVQADPLREESYRQLMRLYAALGRPGEALSHYQELERLLHQQLQATPSSATRALAEQLQQVAPQPRKAREARAADIPAHADIAAVAADLPGTKRAALKVPLQFTRFYGREEAIAHLIHTLSVPQEASESGKTVSSVSGSRLVTLTGPGGTGKTRLSIELAGRLKESFAGGIWFVALADLNDPLLVGEAIHDVLELPPHAQSPALEQVCDYLDGLEQPCLLILDNFEQIASGGASVVWTLLQRVALLSCLVTSRQPLSLPGERDIPVQPLPTPTSGESAPASSLLTTHLLTYPSVALFVDRAQAARPVFQITPRNAEAITLLCQKLEGIPLAIELAAARVKTLTPAQMLERLSERFELLASKKNGREERHRSLWAAIDWSYHLLARDLQQFFARLSVFRGGWSLEAAEAVCEEPLALDYLTLLRAHSLILAEEGTEAIRFRMLETIRDFAGEMPTRKDQAELKDRHRDYFLTLAETAEKTLQGAEQGYWLQRLEQEHDNLRTALQRCLEEEGGDAVKGLRFASSLWRFWYHRGHWSEGRAYSERALAQKGAQERTKWRAKALYAAACIAQNMGDTDTAQAWHEQALAISREIGDRQGMAGSFSGLGGIAFFRGDLEAAQALFTQSLQLHRELGDKPEVANLLLGLAGIRKGQGDWEEAQSLFEESLALHREVGNQAGEAQCLNALGNLVQDQGRYQEARSLFEQSLNLNRALEDRRGIAASLVNLGNVATDLQDAGAAHAYYEESLALNRELGARYGVAIVLVNLGLFVYKQGDHADARDYLMECMKLSQSIDAKGVATYALEELAALVTAQGQAEQAVRLYGAATALHEAIPYSRPEHLEELDRALKALRTDMGEKAFKAAWDAGLALTFEQAIASALVDSSDIHSNLERDPM